MTKPINSYDENMINLICKRDGCKIIERPEKITSRENPILYKCVCGSSIKKKTIRYMNEKGAFCDNKKCKPENIDIIFNPSKRKCYNLELLLLCETRDKCYLIYYPEKLNANSGIIFKCKCGNEHEKPFRLLEERGAFCKPCMDKIRTEKTIQTNMETHGVEHTAQRPDVKEKRRETNIDRYGVPNVMQNENIKTKQQESLYDNHGVYHPSQSQDLRNKAREMMEERYGGPTTMQSDILKEKTTATMIENGGYTLQRPASIEKYETAMSEKHGGKYPILCPEIKNQIQDTCIDKYGSISPFGNKEIQEKSKNTNIKKYGVSNAMQNGNILKKQQNSSYKYKKYILPDGKIIYLQGYEPYIYNLLLEDYHQDEIISGVNKVPIMKYIFENKVRVYFCDIFIPKENKIIEVKSKYTYEKELERNILKKEACISEGYKFEFYIYDKKSKVLNIL